MILGIGFLVAPQVFEFSLNRTEDQNQKTFDPSLFDERFRTTGAIFYFGSMLFLVSGLTVLLPHVGPFAAWLGGKIPIGKADGTFEIGGGAFLFLALSAMVGLFGWAYEPWDRGEISELRDANRTLVKDLESTKSVNTIMTNELKVYDQFFKFIEGQNVGLFRVAIQCYGVTAGQTGDRFWIDWTASPQIGEQQSGHLKRNVQSDEGLLSRARAGSAYTIFGEFDGNSHEIFKAEFKMSGEFLTLEISPNDGRTGDGSHFSLGRFCKERLDEQKLDQGIVIRSNPQQLPSLEGYSAGTQSQASLAEAQSIADQ